jgi:hypothetical protein
MPVTCPKCQHHFDPAALNRGRKKAVKREQPVEKNIPSPSSVLAGKKSGASKGLATRVLEDDDGAGDDMGTIAEIEDVDDLESLKELSELEEMESTPVNEDDADEEAIIDDLETGDKAIVGDIEEEEAKAIEDEFDEDELPVKPAKGSKSKYPSS